MTAIPLIPPLRGRRSIASTVEPGAAGTTTYVEYDFTDDWMIDFVFDWHSVLKESVAMCAPVNRGLKVGKQGFKAGGYFLFQCVPRLIGD
jgi:hypothetical protein